LRWQEPIPTSSTSAQSTSQHTESRRRTVQVNVRNRRAGGPVQATPAVITALKSNDVAVAFEILAPVLPQIKGGALKALASDLRTNVSELPTCRQLPRAACEVTRRPRERRRRAARTPRTIVDRLNLEINAAVTSADLSCACRDSAFDARGSTPRAARVARLRNRQVGKPSSSARKSRSNSRRADDQVHCPPDPNPVSRIRSAAWRLRRPLHIFGRRQSFPTH